MENPEDLEAGLRTRREDEVAQVGPPNNTLPNDSNADESHNSQNFNNKDTTNQNDAEQKRSGADAGADNDEKNALRVHSDNEASVYVVDCPNSEDSQVHIACYNDRVEFERALCNQKINRSPKSSEDSCDQILVIDNAKTRSELHLWLVTYLGCRGDGKETSEHVMQWLKRREFSKPIDGYKCSSEVYTWMRASPRKFIWTNRRMELHLPREDARPLRAWYEGFDSIQLSTGRAVIFERITPAEVHLEYALPQKICRLRTPEAAVIINFSREDHEGPESPIQSRKHRLGPTPICSVTERLIHEISRSRFVSLFGEETHKFLDWMLCDVMVDDESQILQLLSQELEVIDVEMSSAKKLLYNVSLWQWCIGHWRAYLYSRLDFKQRLRKRSWARQVEDVEDFGSKTDYLLRHVESTVNTLIGTMSIQESKRAIIEAEEVTKLTQLAFFFIPLTFVCGIFGMNLNELTNTSIWVWVLTSVFLLLSTYFILYRDKIWRVLKHIKRTYKTEDRNEVPLTTPGQLSSNWEFTQGSFAVTAGQIGLTRAWKRRR